MSIFIEGEEYIDSTEVSKKIGIAGSTLKVMVRAKEVPLPMKLRTLTYWKKSEIDEYLERTREKTS